MNSTPFVAPDSNPSITSIKTLEEQLRVAMLHSDVATLDRLISPDLIFTNHLGQVMSKQDDLEWHRSGILQFQSLEVLEQQITIDRPIAIVSVHMTVSGVYDRLPFGVDLRYTRIWRQSTDDTWHIIVGHSSAVQH